MRVLKRGSGFDPKPAFVAQVFRSANCGIVPHSASRNFLF